MKHSQLPWKVLAGWLITDNEGGSVASTRENDAEFIVTAVNSHDALVAKVKELEDTLIYLTVERTEQLLKKKTDEGFCPNCDKYETCTSEYREPSGCCDDYERAEQLLKKE